MGGVTHVVGAGLAGLSTALRLAERGRAVVVHEAAAFAGGRCRTMDDPRLGCPVDNGNHLVLTGNRAARAYLAATGAGDALVAAPAARFPFVDLATGARWTVAPGPSPLWPLDPARRPPGVRARDLAGALALALAGPGATVAEAIRARGPVWARFWEPLTLAAVNAPPERASARLLWAVLRETFLRGEAACRPMFAPQGLGAAFVTPALARLAALGVRVRYGRALVGVTREGGRAQALGFADGPEPLTPQDRVVLALPPTRLRAAMPELAPPEDRCAILNAHFRLAPGALGDAPPLIGVLGGATQWVFRRGDVVSVTISAAEDGPLADEPAETLAPRLWDETRRALGLREGLAPLAARVNKERRATFDQSPGGAARRLAPRTALGNLFLAGDHVATGLPATIEGAIRSGETAARLAA
jgi:squalene-associated FAD-dependent desaturase